MPDLTPSRFKFTVNELGIVVALSVSLLIIGTLGYLLIDPEHTDPFGALYMTVITLTTTGFSEYPGISGPAQAFTLLLLMCGYGVMALLIAKLTEVFVIGQIYRDRRLQKVIRHMNHHVIVAGCGRIGESVARDLAAARTPFVVIENDSSRRAELSERGWPVVIGDATDESTLREAGVERARGLIACLESDADNLFLTLSARELNHSLRIVSRASSPRSNSKMQRAGADRVISPYESGASQMVNAIIRPAMLDFIEVVSGKSHLSLALEDLVVSPTSDLVGMTLASSPIRSEYGVFVIAIRQPKGPAQYNPPATAQIVAGESLICVGQQESVERLKVRVTGKSD
ncbi:MAG: TrkA family potassium uptake protein [Planctomycetota bacterium]